MIINKNLKKKNRAILTDMDGTLFDTCEVNYQAYKYALEKYGYSIKKTEFYESFFGKSYREFLPNVVGNNQELVEQVHKIKKECYPQFLGSAKLNSFLLTILRKMKEEAYIGLVTTASRKNVMDCINYFLLCDLFDIVITQEDVDTVKPDPQCYQLAMKKLKLLPKDCLIYEDSELGIAAARNSGASVFRVISFVDE